MRSIDILAPTEEKSETITENDDMANMLKKAIETVTMKQEKFDTEQEETKEDSTESNETEENNLD